MPGPGSPDIASRRALPVPACAAPPGWRFAEATRDLFCPDGAAIHLTTAKFGLLQALVCSKGQLVPREALSKLTFGRPWRFGDRPIGNAVVVLRRKLGDERANGYVRTVRGVGYAFVGFPGT